MEPYGPWVTHMEAGDFGNLWDGVIISTKFLLFQLDVFGQFYGHM